jgi:hypothetical protein
MYPSQGWLSESKIVSVLKKKPNEKLIRPAAAKPATAIAGIK